jgi:hypothetical protein
VQFCQKYFIFDQIKKEQIALLALLTLTNLQFLPSNFHNSNFASIVLLTFAKYLFSIDFDQINTHMDNDSQVTLAYLAT